MYIGVPCPFAQSIAAYMTLPDPRMRPKVHVSRQQLRDMKLVDAEDRPVERKGLGENVDTYA